jgi:hypothetical protein
MKMAGVNMFDMIKGAAGGMVMKQVAQQFGLNGAQAEGAIRALLPAVSGGLKRNTAQEGGLQGLMGALQGVHHDRYLDDPAELTKPETVQDGNAILGHLLGSKDMSRQVASHAAQKTGLDTGILKKMLPMVAAMAMGSLSKQAKQPSVSDALMGALSGGGAQSAGGGGLAGMVGSLLGGGQKPQAQSSGINLGMLGGLLDADGDGNPMDDILNMVMKR